MGYQFQYVRVKSPDSNDLLITGFSTRFPGLEIDNSDHILDFLNQQKCI